MARTQVEKMLEALLRSQGLIEWVGGYVYGRTSNDDPFIILYPAADHLKEKVCRVYPHQFKKLPPFIPADDVPADTENNPSKGQAQRAGIYHECPTFKIVMHLGKDTQMGREKRFSDVLYAPHAARPQKAEADKRSDAPSKRSDGTSDKPPSNGKDSEGDKPAGDYDLFDLSYANGVDVVDASNTAETAAFFAYQRAHTGAPMNRRELRRWWKAQEKGGD